MAACFLQHAYGISGEEALQRIGRAYDTRGDTGMVAALCSHPPEEDRTRSSRHHAAISTMMTAIW